MNVSKYDSQILKFWIFAVDFWKKIAYSLVCNMWNVGTRPTSASDFLAIKSHDHKNNQK
jgi:hypothetical protein